MSIGARLYSELRGDRVIWMILALLALFSILAVYSATGSMAFAKKGGNTEFYLIKQTVLVIGGFLIAYLCYQIPYHQYNRWAPYLLMLAIPMLVYTIAFGIEIHDARRWVAVPLIGLTFQTSDFAKVALIVYVARAISSKQEVIKDLQSAFVPIIVPILLICGLIAPNDLSSSLLLFLTCILMMFMGRVDIKYIALLLLLGIVLFAFLIILGTVFPDMVRVDTWVSRLQMFMTNTDGDYQVVQAKIAIADGEWFGKGPGLSSQRNNLPYAYADCIFAIICEEYGLLGGFVVIALYIMLFFRCVALVTRAPKAFGAMLALGLGLSIVIQAMANIAVSVHLVPVTGLTLPMISMGGTSIIFTCIAFGMILSVSRYIEKVVET